PLADLSQHHAGGSSNIDHVQPLNMAYRPQPVATPAPRSAPPPPVSARPVSTPSGPADPFDGFDPFASLVHPKVSVPAPAHVEPEPPPAPERIEPPVEESAGKPRGAASPLASSAALLAFLEGAGLAHLQVSEADAEAFLRESGAIVRASVEGVIGLLLA